MPPPGPIVTAAAAWVLMGCIAALAPSTAAAGQPSPYPGRIEPLLKEFCFDCHGEGMKKGNVALDAFASHADRLARKELWLAVLKNVRSGLMPPPKKTAPSPEQKAALEDWILTEVFALDRADPDPGQVVIRRLNRAEYRNTIRDLMGVEFDTEAEFPADDTGHGFDNLGEVLTLSPMLLEKYLDAAKTVVAHAVPVVAGVPAEQVLGGRQFRGSGSATNTGSSNPSLSYYERSALSNRFEVKLPGRYQVVLDLNATEKFVDGQFDTNKCRVRFSIDGEQVMSAEFTRQGNRPFSYEFPRQWAAGPHEVSIEIEPLTPGGKQVRSLALRLDSVTLRGPLDPAHYVPPKNYARFFPGTVPVEKARRTAYARKVLEDFAGRAFRRPVDRDTLRRLEGIARDASSQPGKTFESGIAQAMVAVLASPRFLFREEAPADPALTSGLPATRHQWVDEHALASRLSYFLWSSMPDETLLQLAGKRQLRASLPEQFQRMLADKRSDALVRNFTGQWLQARDIESVPMDHRAVMRRELTPDPETDRARQRFLKLREKPVESQTPAERDEFEKARAIAFKGFGRFNKFEMTGDLRKSMRQEVERYFAHVLRGDRSLLELIDSDYTFLNQRLAEVYGIEGVEGDELRRVVLPATSPRGGVLTMAGILAVTSNPTRTSPVKRGLFILDNILGTPPPPPPPNIPALEEARPAADGRQPTLRETLAVHRAQPLCSSCHDRMDPLGLALERFNALGRWRDRELNQPIDVAGRLITGESFTNVQQLKVVLATQRRDDFYRCVAEKFLIYALGRGLDYRDEATLEALVKGLHDSGGKPSTLLRGIVASAPFQKIRVPRPGEDVAPIAPSPGSAAVNPVKKANRS